MIGCCDPGQNAARTVEVQAFLAAAGVPRDVVHFARGSIVFEQSAQATSVFYTLKGWVKLSVLSATGQEAVVAMAGPDEFFGEGCVGGQTARTETATALAPTTTLRIQKRDMMRTLHEQPAFADGFIAHILARNLRAEEDFVDRLFHLTEKRLARVLLMLARRGENDTPHTMPPRLSQETLATIVGTTRSRVNIFMNKFRKLGFIDYNNGAVEINGSLLNLVFDEQHAQKRGPRR